MSFWYAAQKARAGHFSHSGAPFGRQTVAPRSIIALVPFAGTLAVDAFGEHGAKTPAHPGVHDVLRDAADPGGDAQEIAVHRRLRLAEGDGGDGARRIVADAGETQKLLARVGKFPAAVVYENLRRTVQVPCAGVVAQTLPELEKPLLAHCRERVHVGSSAIKRA